ncbi:MAG: hypothetical protein PWQ20_603 [Thermotogaceae bacterium]|nr:hypothetical protein [Thermotogaceae bacterium]
MNYNINEKPDDLLIVKASSISGDLQLNFGDSKNEDTKNSYVLSDDEVQRVLRMIESGILKREEGIEILKTIGYSEEEISEIIK